MDASPRLVTIALVFVAAAAGVAWRLAGLQLVEHDFWELEAVKARTRAESLPFRRGSILDAHGRVVAASRSAFDLELRFSHFRKGTAVGQLLLAQFLLTGERARVEDLLDDPAPAVDGLARLTIGELRRIEPGQRRADLLTYVAWLAGEESTRPAVERLREAAADEACWPRLPALRETILARVDSERVALAGLERALRLPRGELAGSIDGAVARIDQRVRDRLARRDRAARTFESERELHRELDDAPLPLVRGIEHALALDLATGRAGVPGLVATEQLRRVNPPENEIPVLLVGRVGLPDAETLARTAALEDERDALALEPAPTAEQVERMLLLDEHLRAHAVRPDEEIGKDGLEAAYERLLRGERGFRRCEHDRSGRVIEVLETEAARPGEDLVLTLDAAQQRAAEAILARGFPEPAGGRRVLPSAFVLIELPAMEIRVLASYPSPTREQFAAGYAALAADEDLRPLHPRAWRPFLPPPPGSSIKPILAAFALTAGVVSEGTELPCSHDELRAPGESRPVRCEGNHGNVAVHRALVKSCNHYFAQLAFSAGSERTLGWMGAVGLGAPTGFTSAQVGEESFRGIGGEVGGHAEREPGGRNLMLLGMGQGKVDATPLQIAAAMGALALRSWQPPTLIRSVGGREPQRPAPVALAISEAAARIVTAAMREVTKPGGTADAEHGADLLEFDLATKTGTPEQAGGRGELRGKDHSWFAGFLPSRAPRFAFAIFVERTGLHGGEAAAPILREILCDPAFAELAAAARAGSNGP